VRGREAIDVLETAVGRSRDRLAELEATRREQESARQYQDREVGQLRVRVEELVAECRRNETEQGAAAERKAKAQQEREAGERALASDQGALDASRNRLQQTEIEVRNRRAAVDGLKARILASARSLAQDEAALGAARQRLVELKAEAERVAAQGNEAGADLEAGSASVAAAGAALREAQERLAEREKALQALVEAVRLGEIEAGRLRALAGAAEQARALVGREEVGIRARRDAIRAMHERHEGMGESLQAALRVPGARGTVAEHLDVPMELEQVLAMALGQALDHVLVESVDAALMLVSAAKGRVGVLLLDDVARDLPADWASVGGSSLGLRALAQLLDGTTVADGVSDALADRVRGVDRVVGGAQPARVGWRGEVAVGRPDAVGTAVLARRRQLVDLEAQLIDVVERLASAQAATDASTGAAAAAHAGLDATRKAREVGREAAADAAIQVRECTRDLDQQQRQYQRDAERVDRVARDRTRLDESQAQNVARMADLGASLRKRGDEQALVETELHGVQMELSTLDGALAASRDDTAKRSAAFAGLKERLLGIRRAEDEAAGVAEAAARRAERAQAETEVARRRIEELSDDDKRLAALLQALGEEQATLRTRLEEEREQVRIGRLDLTRNEAALADTRGRREQASLRRLEAEREVTRVRDELTRIRDQLEERYEVSVTGLLDRLDRNGQVILEADADARDPGIELPDGVSGDLGPAPEDLRIVPSALEDSNQVERWLDQLQKDRAALTRLGEVNLVALQEYTEVAARHAALEAQRVDLDESVRTIRQTVAKLHRLCRERFRETFDLVDGFFRETYPRLVGGGKARLFLTNEDDLLVTGVDIEVQPPGKRLQSLGLMSGGETAMVAIALIFSLFRVKPSPFCLLDEVDAPLDEGNGARFNVMLREMSARSQFIVITHNKKTMECADTLYGVTMAAPGVSRLVSVQLD
jgi:chromosome segregation protein